MGIDIQPSSRHVEVRVGGVTVADSHRPHILLEGDLPPRYYLPQDDVRMDLLVPTDSATRCPYKGTAEYWSVPVGDQVEEDIAWSYATPIPESIRITGLICFYNERVELTIDGVVQP